METQELTLKLPVPLIAALRKIAADDDVSVGQIIREAIDRDLRRRAAAKTPVRADERLVAPLRALLAADFAHATSWDDLARRLHGKGYTLAESGGGLILLDQTTGQRICKGSELGYGYAQLLRKFEAPFPNHRHSWLLGRVRPDAKPIPSTPPSPWP